MTKLEEIARAMHKKGLAYSVWSNLEDYTFEPMCQESQRCYLNQEKAALDAMGVIILPADEEPQVDDVGEYGGVFYKRLVDVAIERWLNLSDYRYVKSEDNGIIIIQRNGKPVIQEILEPIT